MEIPDITNPCTKEKHALNTYKPSVHNRIIPIFPKSISPVPFTYNLRKDISKKINRLPLNYYESRTNGEILSRITNDVDTLQMSLNQSLTQLITSVTTLIGVFIMMLSINVWMTLAALLILPVSMFIIQTVMKHSQKYFQDQQSYLGKVNGQGCH